MKVNLTDKITLFLKSGSGGNGSISFRREKFIRKGGPNGGDGGDGGKIIFNVNRKLITLNHLRFKHHHRAGNGENGRTADKHGKNGKNVIIDVPPGTVIMDDEGHEILDLIEGKVIFLKGGTGGMGNSNFKSSTNRAPRTATKGSSGKEEKVVLELRLIADVGLVGKPNAGKSTLLKKLTGSHPEIASYPFTTLNPNLGVLSDGVKTIRIADIPGIIEGASDGKGLGFSFLKHIQRVRMIVFVIDISSEDPFSIYEVLKYELGKYNKKLLNKKHIVLMNKTDLIDKEKENKIKNTFNECELCFSSLINNDTGDVEHKIMNMFNEK